MAQTTIITLENLNYYDGKIKSFIAAEDAKSLKTVAIEGNVLKFYRVEEPVGESAPAYEIELPETDLSALMPKLVGATKGDIVIVGDDGTTVVDSGVLLSSLATKAEVEAVDGKADKNAEDIAAINDAENGILKQSKDYADGKDAAIKAAKDAADAAQADVDALEPRMDAAEEAIDAIEADMGSVDDLQTANKTVAGAINEVLAAVGTGGTAAVVTVTTDTTTEGALKSYTIKQGDTTVGVIDIPKDMVVESGSVVTNPEGQPEGTYIKLVLANVAEPLYINVGSLVDIYTAKAGATQVQLAIDSSTREISATIVAGSIGSTELADGAVTTVKIADANVTLAKLSASVQASLAKADAAAPQTALDEEVARAKAAEAKVLEDANAHTDEKDAAMDARVKVVEGKAHEHANKEELDKIASGDKAKWDEAAQKAHEHANKDVIDGIDADKVAAWDAAEQNAKDYVDQKVAGVDLSGIATNAEAIAALEEKVGDGFKAATEADIDAWF